MNRKGVRVITVKKMTLAIILSVVGVILLYAVICAGITFVPMIKMAVINTKASGVAGEPAQTVVLDHDVNLYVFPCEGGKDKYVVVCPGGGYVNCEIKTEGFAIAAKLNELGYTAFVLEYRTGKRITTPKAPLDDLANAVRHIDENAHNYKVGKGNYALCGFSAGGNLIGLFGTAKFGYANYEGINAPAALIMGYPWCNPSPASFNGNITDFIYYSSLNGNGAKAFLHSKKSYDEMQVPLWIDDNYPRTFIMHGDFDVIAPAEDHSDILAAALDSKNIEYVYKKYEGVPHGCGLGIGTSAEGWLEEGMIFADK